MNQDKPTSTSIYVITPDADVRKALEFGGEIINVNVEISERKGKGGYVVKDM